MQNRNGILSSLQCGLKLKQAPGIAGNHDSRLERRDKGGFAVAKLIGSVGLNEVIDSRGTATDRRFRYFQ